jgi:hypothetical protein
LISARIRKGAKPKKNIQIFFLKSLRVLERANKNDENEYKPSLGCLRQKPIGVLNSARIGGDVKSK